MAARRLPLLVLIISFFLTAAAAYAAERPSFLRATMSRTEPAINFTRAAHKSHQRLSMLAASGGGAQAPLQLDGGGGAYDMTFSMGTPAQTLSALADTGSDLIWAKCGPCAQCAPQGSPSYNPNASSSFSKLPCSDRLCQNLESQSLASCGGAGAGECDYRYTYGLSASSHHYTQGYLATETFTLGGAAVPDIGFGCTNMSEGGYGVGSGLVGLGRGPLSLVSQLGAGAFSYCLTTDASKSSPLLFGSGAALSGAGVQSTPLLQDSTFYSVNLETISIGDASSPGTGSGGIVFDSGTTVAFLADPYYSQAKAALLSQAGNLTAAPGRDGYEVCFQTSGGEVFPAMVLHFDGGADMALPTENCYGEVASGVTCWIVQKSPSLSIVGNIMQMSFHIRYDVDNSVLSFQPANCDSL